MFKERQKQESRLAQDARIEAENNYRAEQQLAKDRRAREQKAYRDYLFTQMNEKKARDSHKRWQENIMLENRMMANNDRNDAIKKHTTSIDVNEMQKMTKDVLPQASHMT